MPNTLLITVIKQNSLRKQTRKEAQRYNKKIPRLNRVLNPKNQIHRRPTQIKNLIVRVQNHGIPRG